AALVGDLRDGDGVAVATVRGDRRVGTGDGQRAVTVSGTQHERRVLVDGAAGRGPDAHRLGQPDRLAEPGALLELRVEGVDREPGAGDQVEVAGLAVTGIADAR